MSQSRAPEPRNKTRFKKYVVFAYEQFYPAGGTGDIRDSFDSLEEVAAFLNGVQRGRLRHWDSVEVIDRDTWEEIPVNYAKGRYTVEPSVCTLT